MFFFSTLKFAHVTEQFVLQTYHYFANICYTKVNAKVIKVVFYSVSFIFKRTHSDRNK